MPLAVLSASQAQQNLRSNRMSFWPDGRRGQGGRMGVYASVAMKPSFQFVAGESVFTIGSCFAREIEKALSARGFDLPMTRVRLPSHENASSVANDILNKYISHSMANELRWALDPASAFPEAAYLELDDGQWHDPHLVHNLKPAPLERVKERRAEVMAAAQAARRARVFVITLGLAEAWFDRAIGLYLNGAPPPAALSRHPDRFEFHVLSYRDILESLEDIHALLTRFGHRDFRVLITVSPVPFKASFSGHDAMAANCYSKSVQRAAVEEFVLAHANVDYFPSYETVTLGERSASFMPDNIHVQPAVVARIVNQVVSAYLPASAPAAVGAAVPAEGPAPAMYRAATERVEAGDYVTACNLLRNISETFGSGACGVPAHEFHLRFGICLLRSKLTSAAESELHAAVKLNPADGLTRYNHGVCLARLKRNAEALDAFKKAVSLAPRVVEFRWRLAVELSRQHDNAGALAHLRKALALDPRHAGALKLQAELESPAAAVAPAA